MRRAIVLATVLLTAQLAGTPARAQDVMAAVRARSWPQADAAAAAYADPVARKLVLFYRLLTPQAASLAELDTFIASSPDWPMQAGLARRRDEALAAEPDDAAALAACGHPPALAIALARCAQASLRQNRAGAEKFARAAWIAADPDPAWEANFLQGFGPEIGPEPNWRRFERLAWASPADAARVTSRLDGGDRQTAEAILALRRDDPRAADLVSAVPAARRQDPLLVLERLRWLRRAGRDAEALTLWATDGLAAEREAVDHRAPFWDERNILARRRLRDGDVSGAYALTSNTAQNAPEQVADAAFLSGFIALRKLADPARARRHFAALADVSKAALTQSRAQYWLARAAQAQGDEAEAGRALAAAADWPGTFYGQLAAGEEAAATRIAAARDPVWDREQALAFAGRELARAAAWLVAWGDPRRASTFLLRLPEIARDPVDLSLAAHLAAGFGMTDTAVTLARRAGRSGVVLLQAGWPVAAAIPSDLPAAPPVDAALTLGVIRQESSFDASTVSPAGARGLMQLMPATAAQVGRQLGVDAPLAALVGDPALNIRLGATYLAGVLQKFDGAVPLAVAAYNAGPSRVTDWLGAYGDPRTGAPEMIDWIELIPFTETRNYVQRVIENTVVYRVRLGEAPTSPLGRWPRSPA